MIHVLEKEETWFKEWFHCMHQYMQMPWDDSNGMNQSWEGYNGMNQARTNLKPALIQDFSFMLEEKFNEKPDQKMEEEEILAERHSPGLGEQDGEDSQIDLSMDAALYNRHFLLKNNDPIVVHCVTSLYQQECFPLLYIQKNSAILRNQKMILSLSMLLRTHYEGFEKEWLCLKKIRRFMNQIHHGKNSTTYFQEKNISFKMTDKKMRETLLQYDARITLKRTRTEDNIQ